MNAFASVMCVVSFRPCASGITCWIGSCGAGVRGRGFLDAVERIHHEHRIARFGEPFAHLAERRPQSEDVRPHENAWGRAARRMHEVAVRGAVRRRHVHVRFGHGNRVRDLRQHHGHACSQHHAELLSCHQTESLVLLAGPLQNDPDRTYSLLVNAWLRGRQHAYCNILYPFDLRWVQPPPRAATHKRPAEITELLSTISSVSFGVGNPATVAPFGPARLCHGIVGLLRYSRQREATRFHRMLGSKHGGRRPDPSN